jgi:hypothetical protein
MTRSSFIGTVAGAFALASSGCGPGVVVTSANPSELRAALFASAEELSVTPDSDRSKLYDELVAVASDEASRQEPDAPVLFPVATDQRVVAAPFSPNLDLLKPPADAPDVELVDTPERWSAEPQPGLMGATERGTAIDVSRSLLAEWHVTNHVLVVRAPAVPFAAAFVDGQLRLNPALLYLAVAHAVPAESSAPPPELPVQQRPASAPGATRIPDQPNPTQMAPTVVATPGTAAPTIDTPASAPPVPSSVPLAPIGTAGGLVTAGLLGSWLLRRR